MPHVSFQFQSLQEAVTSLWPASFLWSAGMECLVIPIQIEHSLSYNVCVFHIAYGLSPFFLHVTHCLGPLVDAKIERL